MIDAVENMNQREQIPIWFFIGGLLLVYGVIITAVGVYNLTPWHVVNPGLALQRLHADLWWGIVLIALGGFYTVYYFPSRRDKG
jgi:hypothetical protein